jgi:hypothetical protein
MQKQGKEALIDKAASRARRDQLLTIQGAAQKQWAEAKLFEADAPEGGAPVPEGKFFGNFPYPYMNGVLHLGHAFSISKLEFAAAFHRLCGKRTLFPQAFHCTGAITMPRKQAPHSLQLGIPLLCRPLCLEGQQPVPEGGFVHKSSVPVHEWGAAP